MSSRHRREAAFHDRAFLEGTRAPFWKYYEIMDETLRDFDARLSMWGSGEEVLEIGCATGERCHRLAREVRHVVGIDVSPFAIATAITASADLDLHTRVSFEVMDAEHLRYGDDTFGLVCGSAVLHHLNLDRAFDEIRRVLRPTGRAVFMEPLGHNPVINYFRRSTPSYRTADEHPLVRRDLVLASHYFEAVHVTHYHLLSLAALPLRRTRWFQPSLAGLNTLDTLLFRLPAVRFWSWYSVITLSGPKK